MERRHLTTGLVLAVVAWLIGIVIRPIVEPSDRRR